MATEWIFDKEQFFWGPKAQLAESCFRFNLGDWVPIDRETGRLDTTIIREDPPAPDARPTSLVFEVASVRHVNDILRCLRRLNTDLTEVESISLRGLTGWCCNSDDWQTFVGVVPHNIRTFEVLDGYIIHSDDQPGNSSFPLDDQVQTSLMWAALPSINTVSVDFMGMSGKGNIFEDTCIEDLLDEPPLLMDEVSDTVAHVKSSQIKGLKNLLNWSSLTDIHIANTVFIKGTEPAFTALAAEKKVHVTHCRNYDPSIVASEDKLDVKRHTKYLDDFEKLVSLPSLTN